MLIIDKNSVYEIDEECLKRKKMPKECGTAELVEEMKKERRNRIRKNKKELENKFWIEKNYGNWKAYKHWVCKSFIGLESFEIVQNTEKYFWVFLLVLITYIDSVFYYSHISK